jgi:asparagine synthase (glutamine-hydrolysing)
MTTTVSPARNFGFLASLSKTTKRANLDQIIEHRICKKVELKTSVLVILGEVYDGNRQLNADDIARTITGHGARCVANWEGAFLCVNVDSVAGKIEVYTDVNNTYKCFRYDSGSEIYLSSSLRLLGGRVRELDPVGVWCYVVNGCVYNNRTIFRNVRALESGTVHTIASSHSESHVYSRIQFEGTTGDCSGATAELRDLIVESVERRTRDAGRIVVSLGGGWASACLLGCLNLLGKSHVSAFSYGGSPNRLSPFNGTFVARQVAEAFRVPHVIEPGYKGYLPSTVEANALWGDGRANFCGEWDIWKKMNETADPDTIFLTGDDCFGGKPHMLSSGEDVLKSIGIDDGERWGSLADKLNLRDARVELLDELRAVASKVDGDGWFDIRDTLYAQQRLTHLVLPWRELFCGLKFPVRSPLLESKIIRFAARQPRLSRVGKSYFIQTVKTMFPGIDGILCPKIAHSPAWFIEVDRWHSGLRALVDFRQAPTDQYFSRQICLAALDAAVQDGRAGLSRHVRLDEKQKASNDLIQPEKIQLPKYAVAMRMLTLRLFVQSLA